MIRKVRIFSNLKIEKLKVKQLWAIEYKFYDVNTTKILRKINLKYIRNNFIVFYWYIWYILIYLNNFNCVVIGW
jgi:hypothetical protein